jgi:hypothetical protein
MITLNKVACCHTGHPYFSTASSDSMSLAMELTLLLFGMLCNQSTNHSLQDHHCKWQPHIAQRCFNAGVHAWHTVASTGSSTMLHLDHSDTEICFLMSASDSHFACSQPTATQAALLLTATCHPAATHQAQHARTCTPPPLFPIYLFDDA